MIEYRDDEYNEMRSRVTKDRDTLLVIVAGDRALMRRQAYDDMRQRLVDQYIISAKKDLTALAEARTEVYTLKKELEIAQTELKLALTPINLV